MKHVWILTNGGQATPRAFSTRAKAKRVAEQEYLERFPRGELMWEGIGSQCLWDVSDDFPTFIAVSKVEVR